MRSRTWLFLLFVAGCVGEQTARLDDAGELLIEAQEALAGGDTTQAMELLTASIDARPTPWAYFQRAKLYLAQENEQEALADCERGLALEQNYDDLQWLRDEIQKPAKRRFQGKHAAPPSLKK